MKVIWFTKLALIALYVPLNTVTGERDRFMYCGACLCMVEEMGWQLGATDEKKTIQVGSFRLDERGRQKGAVQVPFKRSEVHMIELMEGICSTMYDYHIQTNPKTSRKTFVRTSSRTGEAISLTNVMISEDTTKQLRFSCDTLVEEHEDAIIELFQNKERNIEEKLCVDIAKMCTTDDVEQQRWGTVNAIVTGMKELQQKKYEDEYDDEYEEEDDEYEEEDDEYEEEDDEEEWEEGEEPDEYVDEEDDEYANEEDNEDDVSTDASADSPEGVVTKRTGGRNQTGDKSRKEEL